MINAIYKKNTNTHQKNKKAKAAGLIEKTLGNKKDTPDSLEKPCPQNNHLFSIRHLFKK